MQKSGLIIAAALIVSGSSFAQSRYTEHTLRLDDPANRPPASIEDLAWFAGHWRGEGLGGSLEELWAPPFGSTMSGTFKLARDGKTVFIEMMAFVEEANSLALWVKHFNPDFTGWEEKDDKVVFPLVRLEADAAYFQGLTFRRVGDDKLDVYLVMTRRDEVREEKLTYRRTAPL